MSRELVRLSGGDGTRSTPLNALGHPEQAGDEWDLPPEQMGYGPRRRDNPQPVHTAQHRRAAKVAADDSARARARGDDTFAGLRDSDAGDLRQSRWDWGDGRTWLWLIGMCVGFLLMVALCYYLPQGRHSSPPPIRVY